MHARARSFAALGVGAAVVVVLFSFRSRSPVSTSLADAGESFARAHEAEIGHDDAAAAPLADAARDGFLPPLARITTAGLCGSVADGLEDHLVSPDDLRASFVDGDDPLALVNRSPRGQLAPSYVPSDLVDLRTGKPATASDCEGAQCLRREAAAALADLLADMKAAGFPGKVESAFRSYSAQCWTFLGWEKKGSFCNAIEQSALPGHSQHQLGTAVDLFTEEWSDIAKDAGDERGVFRGGFGCSPGGQYIKDHAPERGFVLSYPIHPDDRHPDQSCVLRWDIVTGINPKTGYKNEAWHLRYLGKDAAQRFLAAVKASGEGTPDEISLEQWLRRERGLGGADVDLPVCDGCNCGACATLSPFGANACDKNGGALHLDDRGLPLAASAPPRIQSAELRATKEGPALVVIVRVPRGTVTQPPIVGRDAASYSSGGTYLALVPYPKSAPRAFAPLEGAWVVGVEDASTGASTWPWRAALVDPVQGRLYDKANVLLPAREGETKLRVALPAGVTHVRVALLRAGVADGAPIDVTLP